MGDPAHLEGGDGRVCLAPLLTQADFGLLSKAKKFAILARLQVSISGQPPHGQAGVVTVGATNAKGTPVKGAAVRLGGAEVETGTHRTNKKGVVTFTPRPTKLGNLAAMVTKKLFKTGSVVVAIA